MSFLSQVRDLFVDFIFPKSRKVLELESLSPAELLETLPPAEAHKDKNILAIFDYSHPVVKEIIWELKYGGNIRIAEKLGVVLYDVVLQELEERKLFEKWSRPILVPIPISDKRRFERGWSQSELLTKQIIKHDHQKTFRYLPRQLAKLRHTESQTKTSSKDERKENISNSMKVLNEQSVAGECIIIVDDVTTTGSTFAEARRALRAAGAKKILCIAVAH